MEYIYSCIAANDKLRGFYEGRVFLFPLLRPSSTLASTHNTCEQNDGTTRNLNGSPARCTPSCQRSPQGKSRARSPALARAPSPARRPQSRPSPANQWPAGPWISLLTCDLSAASIPVTSRRDTYSKPRFFLKWNICRTGCKDKNRQQNNAVLLLSPRILRK